MMKVWCSTLRPPDGVQITAFAFLTN